MIKLTKIEADTLRLYADDCLTIREIGKLRNRAESTITTQLQRLQVKMQARNNHELIKLYWQWRNPGDREYASWEAADGK